jgi:predicted AlkP superfamily pyrophosphatase or phosphodiesterase
MAARSRPSLTLVWLLGTACTSAAAPPAPAAPQTVLLISLDGFRWDYIDRPYAVEVRKLAARGVRATRLIAAFPTKTFPNHYTIVTGLYPAHHGIVSNTMWDDAIGKTFSMSARDVMIDTRWWGGEPLWVTAVKQGKKSASFFWPGSDVVIDSQYPTYYRVYDGKIPNSERVRGVLDWLALPRDSAPVFVTMYFSDVDGAGHDFGPDAPQTDSAIARVDTAVGAVVAGLAARGLDDRVNVIVVADHGMTPTSPERQIFLDDYIDTTGVTIVDWSPVAAIIPRRGYDVEEIYRALHGRHPQLAVYRKSELPERWHYRDNPRITPIIAVAADGWHIASHRRPLTKPGGNHGYDNALPSMGALFVAAGPAFRRGVVVPPFQNIHLYELMARITGLRPAPNDGSLDSVRALLR